MLPLDEHTKQDWLFEEKRSVSRSRKEELLPSRGLVSEWFFNKPKMIPMKGNPEMTYVEKDAMDNLVQVIKKSARAKEQDDISAAETERGKVTQLIAKAIATQTWWEMMHPEKRGVKLEGESKKAKETVIGKAVAKWLEVIDGVAHLNYKIISKKILLQQFSQCEDKELVRENAQIVKVETEAIKLEMLAVKATREACTNV